MITHNTEILAIAESHFAKFVETDIAIQEKLASLTVEAATASERDEEPSRLLQMVEDVALVEIKGSLTNRDSYWNRYFGRVSYNEIREAVVQGMDNGAGSFLFDIDSPGGNVAGMADTANFIANIPVKTVSFTSGYMASAAYFLGSQADHLYADDFSEVGSVGVLVKMYDRSKMLSDIGIKPVRFRSGALKAVGDSDFKMSKEEREYVQAKVQDLANKFYSIVSNARGIPMEALERFGITSGRTFVGSEAVGVGLTDGVKTFDESMLKAFDLVKKVDKPNKNSLF